ncbi:hypothetical protein DV738_g5170, partial [Chaetothyriales sp. CBS 135597]
MLLRYTALFCQIASLVAAHGSHDTGRTAESWAEYHMIEEHHVNNFDAPSFFTLHDFNSDGFWTADEVRRFYGLDDESLIGTPADVKDQALRDIFALFDPGQTGRITREAFLQKTREGVQLPDLGLGPGHHGDDEYEYEIHHFEKYHDEFTTEEDLIHPEDIAHFRKHEAMEREQERIEREQSQQIVENNIPAKFRKQQ